MPGTAPTATDSVLATSLTEPVRAMAERVRPWPLADVCSESALEIAMKQTQAAGKVPSAQNEIQELTSVGGEVLAVNTVWSIGGDVIGTSRMGWHFCRRLGSRR